MWFFLTILSAFLWAMINVVNSGIIRKYSKEPSVVLWVQVCFSMIFLVGIWILFRPEPRMLWLLVPVGMMTYFADLFFFWVCSRMDVSLTNAAWCMQSVVLGIIGITVFGERWTIVAYLGAILVLAAVLLLSLRVRTHAGGTIVTYLIPLALLYVPYAFARKAALETGVPLLSTFFWMILSRDGLAFIFPWLVPSERRKLASALPTFPLAFFVTSPLPVTLFFAVEYVSLLALRTGSLSVFSIVSNIQPFFVLALAWLLHRIDHHLAPHEIVTPASLRIKALSFFIAFLGLALLALSQ